MAVAFQRTSRRASSSGSTRGLPEVQHHWYGHRPSLVKDLVELHGGSIEVESEGRPGTEFIVTLPVDRSYFKEEQIDEEAVLPVQKTVTYLEEENAENVVAESPKRIPYWWWRTMRSFCS